MNSYKVNSLSPTQNVGNFTAGLCALTVLLSSYAQAAATKKKEDEVKAPPAYYYNAPQLSFDSYKTYTETFMSDITGNLTTVMADVYSGMLDGQIQLERDLEQILHDNLWDLYES